MVGGPWKTEPLKQFLNKHDSNDTQTRPLNQPTAEHKQTSFELSLHHGDGGMESLPQRPNHIQAHLGQDAMMSTTQQSRRAKNHSCSTILKARNYSQNSDIDTNSIVAQGTLALFLAASVDCVRLIAKLYSSETCHSETLRQKIAEGETSRLGLLGPKCGHSSSEGLKVPIMPKLDSCCVFTQIQPPYTALVVLSISSKKKHHLLPDIRASKLNAMQSNCVEWHIMAQEYYPEWQDASHSIWQLENRACKWSFYNIVFSHSKKTSL